MVPDQTKAPAVLLSYHTSHNYNAGKEAGIAMLNELPDGGKVAVFVGNLSAQNAIDRLQGFRDVVKGSKIEIVREEM